jgi:hypothetical protein
MTKHFLIIWCGLVGFAASAQDDVDALRYSQTTFYGDSRFMAMAGSFGALGANVGCMNYNPAGIAVYRNGEFVLTPGIRVQNTKSLHYDSAATDFSTKFNISNIGFVTAWDQANPYPSSSKAYAGWNQRHAFGISYNRLADFNSNFTINGTAPSTSMTQDFNNLAQGYGPSALNGSYEWLAYQTGLIYLYTNDTTKYMADMNNATQAAPILQTKNVKQSGRSGELAFTFAHAFDDKVYLGATLGVPLIKYSRNSTYTEFDSKSRVPYFRSLQYEEQLVTSGSGVNLKVGGIYRVNESVRIGAYVHTPTLINMNDNYQYTMTSGFDNYVWIPANNDTALGGKQSYTGFFKYRLYTPMRAGVSAAYVYKHFLAANIDAEFVDYGMARYKDNGNYLNSMNLVIAKKYTGTANIRAGAELNLQPFVIRVGYAGYGSPFGSFTGKFARSMYTAGVGFKHKSNTYFDLGVLYSRWKEDYYLYDPSLVNATSLSNSVVYVTATVGVKFN